MSNVSQTEAPRARPLPGRSVNSLAATALSYVAYRQRETERSIVAERVAQLQKAVTEGSTAEALSTIRQMVRAGTAPSEIADQYVPVVARQLGDLWCADEIGFATVTIGVARLQGLLREIEAMTVLQRRAARDGASLLILVAEGIDHTLGAMVLGGQLRRAGHAVRLILAAEPRAVTAAIRATQFEAVLVSAPDGTLPERLKPLVQAVKEGTRQPPPVVVGGTIIDQARKSGTDILALTGADHATSNLDEALRLCGLTGERREGFDQGPGY